MACLSVQGQEKRVQIGVESVNLTVLSVGQSVQSVRIIVENVEAAT